MLVQGRWLPGHCYGAKLWSGTVGQATNGPVLSGIAIGGGLLVVPAGSTLTVFGN
jgi:hypothetical protein